MVVVKYLIKDEGMFISHESMKRIWRRLLAISRINIEKTKERNAKEILFFMKKPPVGVESQSEFVAFETTLLAREVESALENNLPKWLVIEKMMNCESSNNPFEENTLSQYKLVQTEIDEKKNEVEKFFGGQDAETKKRILTHEVAQDCVIFLAKDKNFEVFAFVNELLKSLGLEKRYFNLIKEETYYDSKGEVELLENKFKN